MRKARTALVLLIGVLLVTACSRPGRATLEGGGAAQRDDTRPSLAAKGGPAYELEATIDPVGGSVDGKVTVRIPASDRRRIVPFRVLPNLAGLDTGFRLTGGDASVSDLSGTVVSVPRGSRAQVTLAFEYILPSLERPSILDALVGGVELDPEHVGLLGRHENGAALGHWFPTYLPQGVASSARLRGNGDIGNYAAGSFYATLHVPSTWTLISSGRTLKRSEQGVLTTYVEVGSGLRDFGVYLGKGMKTSQRRIDGVTIRTWARPEHAERLGAVTDTAAAALRLFSESFGRQPWPELDVVETPLGAGIGGMEWPGMVWIAPDAFSGGVPGLGKLGEIFGEDTADLLGRLIDSDELAELGLGSTLAGLETTADFVLVHEIAHEWWFALVGSDSLTSGALDEPLAQYSGCFFFRELRPAQAAAACETNVTGQYRVARVLGTQDAVANRPTDQFESSLQYGAVVYGKAPGFYLELEKLLGRRTLVAGLRNYARANAFRIAQDEDLLRALTQAAPRRAGDIRRLWRRWMEETHGDEDLQVSGARLGGLSKLLEGLLGD
jgi:hypothetical protein